MTMGSVALTTINDSQLTIHKLTIHYSQLHFKLTNMSKENKMQMGKVSRSADHIEERGTHQRSELRTVKGNNGGCS